MKHRKKARGALIVGFCLQAVAFLVDHRAQVAELMRVRAEWFSAANRTATKLDALRDCVAKNPDHEAAVACFR